MGGENEKPLRTVKDSPAKELHVMGGTGRIHEDKGQVHLHEGGPGDKTKLKVAVPTYVFHERLTEWVAEGMSKPLTFVDSQNGAFCVISLVTPLSSGDIDVSLTWQKVNILGNLKALIEHAEAR